MARQKTAQSQSVRTTLSGVVREDVLAKLRVSFETYSILDAVDEVDGSHIRENARIKVRFALLRLHGMAQGVINGFWGGSGGREGETLPRSGRRHNCNFKAIIVLLQKLVALSPEPLKAKRLRPPFPRP